MLLVLFLVLFINKVHATEPLDITTDIEIRYKWYKEKIVGGSYVPAKSIKDIDIIDSTKIQYGEYNTWDAGNCNVSEEYYHIQKTLYRDYLKVRDARYVLLENVNYNNNIKIYHNKKPIDFELISNQDNIVKIDLKLNYMCENLIFLINNSNNYKIGLYYDSTFKNNIISKEIINEQLLIPDKTWITQETKFENYTSINLLENTDFTTLVGDQYRCRYKEKYIYKYEIEREYYDDNYHTQVDGYIKDEQDFKYFYVGTPLNNTIEIIKEKIVKIPQVKYIYIEKENNKIENDSSNQKTCPEIIRTKVETKTIEKKIFQIPKQFYFVLFFLILTILFLLIYKTKKMSTK